MARLAVLASGNGTNFQSIVEALRARDNAHSLDDEAGRHECVLLIHDKGSAYAAQRAKALGVPSLHVSYVGKVREEAEAEIGTALEAAGADLVALAGFMRLLSPTFVRAWKGRLVNIHPSLLPAWPGAGAIARAYAAGEVNFGVSVHFVDEGMDTGPLIAQDEIVVKKGESLAELETRVHELEHRLYPGLILKLLDRVDAERGKA